MGKLNHKVWCAVLAVSWISGAAAGIDQPWNEPRDIAPGAGGYLGWALLALSAEFALFVWSPRVFLGGLALLLIGGAINRWFGSEAAALTCIAMCIWWLLPSRGAKTRLQGCDNPLPLQAEESPEVPTTPVRILAPEDAPLAHHKGAISSRAPARQVTDTPMVTHLRAKIDKETKQSWARPSFCPCGHPLKIEHRFKGAVRCEVCGRLTRVGLDG